MRASQRDSMAQSSQLGSQRSWQYAASRGWRRHAAEPGTVVQNIPSLASERQLRSLEGATRSN